MQWSTGELTIDSGSFQAVFKVTSVGDALAAKPLGCLTRASAVGPDNTFVVWTSDSLHQVYRFAFSTERDAEGFAGVAQRAATAAQIRLTDMPETCEDVLLQAAELEKTIRAALPERWPLTFPGVELFGPDPAGEPGSEVLLVHGVAVLLDPPSDNSGVIGTYELLFYSFDEGAQKAACRFTIGPRTRLSQCDEDSDGPVSFDFRVTPGVPKHMLAFEEPAVAATFARDFRVRQRLMELSLKTAKGMRSVKEARGELEELRRQSLSASVVRLVSFFLMLVCLACVVRFSMLFYTNRTTPPREHAIAVLAEARLLLASFKRETLAMGSSVCERIVGSVPAADLQRCVSLVSPHQVVECAVALVQP